MDAPGFARGFVGIAFRIDDKKRFEGLYLRPANSRVEDQVRRNHSVQYFAYPDYDFARLRKDAPVQYEAYTDIALGEWIHMKIVVSGEKARLYVNNMEQPVLLVNELKLGARPEGRHRTVAGIRHGRLFQRCYHHDAAIAARTMLSETAQVPISAVSALRLIAHQLTHIA